MAGGSASALSISRPAQASLALRPAGSLSRPRRPLSRGFETAGYPTAPLVSYYFKSKENLFVNVAEIVMASLNDEVARVLRPGGRYVLETPHRHTGPHDVSAHFDDVVGAPAGELPDLLAPVRLLAVVDRVMAAVRLGQLGLLGRADGADHGGAEVIEPLAGDQPDAAGGGVHETGLAALQGEQGVVADKQTRAVRDVVGPDDDSAVMVLDEDGGIAMYVAAEKPDGVPEENWLPIERKDMGLSPQMRIYVPDLKKYQTWKPPVAEKL